MKPSLENAAIRRCPWAEQSAIERVYHDRVWGVPQHQERGWFEFLVLEGAQAGLSWRTVLARQAAYRQAFFDYDIARIAAMSDTELEARRSDPGLIRNRLKIASVRSNALAALRLIDEIGSLDAYFWSFVAGVPQCNHWRLPTEVPATTLLSDRLSRDLKQRGFRFVGSTICYALMQAMGLINDHLVTCFRHPQLASAGRH